MLFHISCSYNSVDKKYFINTNLYMSLTPNPNLLSGIYINTLDATHDTLILPNNMTFGVFFGMQNIDRDQLFFFLTQDSTGKSVTIRGSLSYTFYATDGGGDSTGYMTFERNDRISDWTSRVYIVDSTDRIKKLVIKDFFYHTILHPFKIHLPHDGYDIDYDKPHVLLNSRGIPLQFEKIIYLEK